MLIEQYRSAEKLNTRISIHEKYSRNKQGFVNWILSHYKIEETATRDSAFCIKRKSFKWHTSHSKRIWYVHI